jgi:hypothetical protein
MKFLWIPFLMAINTWAADLNTIDSTVMAKMLKKIGITKMADQQDIKYTAVDINCHSQILQPAGGPLPYVGRPLEAWTCQIKNKQSPKEEAKNMKAFSNHFVEIVAKYNLPISGSLETGRQVKLDSAECVIPKKSKTVRCRLLPVQ